MITLLFCLLWVGLLICYFVWLGGVFWFVVLKFCVGFGGFFSGVVLFLLMWLVSFQIWCLVDSSALDWFRFDGGCFYLFWLISDVLILEFVCMMGLLPAVLGVLVFGLMCLVFGFGALWFLLLGFDFGLRFGYICVLVCLVLIVWFLIWLVCLLILRCFVILLCVVG